MSVRKLRPRKDEQFFRSIHEWKKDWKSELYSKNPTFLLLHCIFLLTYGNSICHGHGYSHRKTLMPEVGFWRWAADVRASKALRELICADLGDRGVSLSRRQWHPTPVLWPGKSHGWRSLVGCSPWGR